MKREDRERKQQAKELAFLYKKRPAPKFIPKKKAIRKGGNRRGG